MYLKVNIYMVFLPLFYSPIVLQEDTFLGRTCQGDFSVWQQFVPVENKTKILQTFYIFSSKRHLSFFRKPISGMSFHPNDAPMILHYVPQWYTKRHWSMSVVLYTKQYIAWWYSVIFQFILAYSYYSTKLLRQYYFTSSRYFIYTQDYGITKWTVGLSSFICKILKPNETHFHFCMYYN